MPYGRSPLTRQWHHPVREAWQLARHQRVSPELAYFQTHRERLHYQRIRRQGGPNGSGAMESLGSAFQDRLQRPGQFWSRIGLRHLLAVDVAVRNQDFVALWN